MRKRIPKGYNGSSDFFIRHYREVDQAEVLRIWHSESINSHGFIPAKFWEGHLDTLKNKYLPESETFVAERDGQIIGFISLIGNYVGALFVDGIYQRQGIGRTLLSFAHKLKGSLFIDVYKENSSAIDFYHKYGLKERRKKIQPETGHSLITMYVGPKN